MKKYLFAIVCLIGTFWAVQAQELSVENDIVDFGQITKGEKATMTFEITNSGNEPLLIQRATGSCGCTVPEYQKTPIAPGESSEIKVLYTAVNKVGPFSKTVTIVSNAKENARKIVRVKGEVVE